MEQVREQNQEQPSTPLRCPRCNSTDTKFRYFNNNDRAQPRHHCRTCKRQWTVGGSLRNIPIGGKPRNNRQPKTSSSISNNPQSELPQPPLLLGEHYLQYLQPPPPPMATPGSYYLNDEISCWDAIQSLIQSDVGSVNQHLNGGYQFVGGGGGGANVPVPPDWNISSDWNMPPMASYHGVPQQIIPGFVESCQTHNQVNNSTPNLYEPIWPMNSFPQDVMNNFGASTSHSSQWNNFNGTITDTDAEMDTESVNVDEWLNLPGYGSS